MEEAANRGLSMTSFWNNQQQLHQEEERDVKTPGGDDLQPKDLLPSAVGGDRKQDKPLNRKLKTACFFCFFLTLRR